MDSLTSRIAEKLNLGKPKIIGPSEVVSCLSAAIYEKKLLVKAI